MIAPGGEETPTSPVMELVPVLVIVEPAKTPKLCAVPRDCASAVLVIAKQATPSTKNAATRDGLLLDMVSSSLNANAAWSPRPSDYNSVLVF